MASSGTITGSRRTSMIALHLDVVVLLLKKDAYCADVAPSERAEILSKRFRYNNIRTIVTCDFSGLPFSVHSVYITCHLSRLKCPAVAIGSHYTGERDSIRGRHLDIA